MPDKKSRLQQLRQAQKQNVIVNLHLADKVKRRRKVKRGGVNRSKPLLPAPLQVATPRRMVQQTIHLPPEAITPQTPFRSQPASHPQYIKTTEHKKKEQELYARELQMGIDQRIAKMIQARENTVTKQTIKKGIKVKYVEPKKPEPLPQVRITPTPPSLPTNPLTVRRTTEEVLEAISMGKEDPNPLHAKKAGTIERTRMERKLKSPSPTRERDMDSPIPSPPSLKNLRSSAFPSFELESSLME